MRRCGGLAVEDHVALANRISEGPRDAGTPVDVVYDRAAALESTTSTDYDVIALDCDQPAMHGDRGLPPTSAPPRQNTRSVRLTHSLRAKTSPSRSAALACRLRTSGLPSVSGFEPGVAR
jgi:CheY-like chemotaxis protein